MLEYWHPVQSLIISKIPFRKLLNTIHSQFSLERFSPLSTTAEEKQRKNRRGTYIAVQKCVTSISIIFLKTICFAKLKQCIIKSVTHQTGLQILFCLGVQNIMLLDWIQWVLCFLFLKEVLYCHRLSYPEGNIYSFTLWYFSLLWATLSPFTNLQTHTHRHTLTFPLTNFSFTYKKQIASHIETILACLTRMRSHWLFLP